MTIARITAAYTRTYSDTGQTLAYVEWVDSRAEHGRTEGCPDNSHMVALMARAEREGVLRTHEVW